MLDLIGEVFEIFTPAMDRDRLFALVPVHLHRTAFRVEGLAREADVSIGRETFPLYALAFWMLRLAGKGEIHLRPSEQSRVIRIIQRQKDTVPWSNNWADQAECIVSQIDAENAI